MKVLSKILGAFLLLGCLAYISFVFGKYVLSSSLLNSIPKSERIISAKTAAGPSTSSPQSNQALGAPRVKMQVMPTSRPPRDVSSVPTDTDNNADANTEATDSTPKRVDDNTSSPSRERRRRRTKRKNTPDSAAPKPSEPAKKSTSSPAPIRQLNRVKKTEDTSPVPKPEKSTYTPPPKKTSTQPPKSTYTPSSNSGDSGTISPVPRPE